MEAVEIPFTILQNKDLLKKFVIISYAFASFYWYRITPLGWAHNAYHSYDSKYSIYFQISLTLIKCEEFLW